MQPSVEDEQPAEQQPQPQPTMSGDDAAMPNPSESRSPPKSQSTEPPNEPPVVQLHPQHDEILRQVEFYFSDENLPHDAHLLSKTGDSGIEWVSLNEILSWRKMRAFKPPALVKASLSQSKKLDVWKNKFIRRKELLRVPITVKAREDPHKERNKELVEKPWLTKNYVKPTGFEKDFVESPLSPDEHEQATKLFDPEQSFTIRIESAVARYMSKRKMHQLTLQIFTKFLMFGGFSSGPHMFTGGFTDKYMKEMELDSEQIAQMKSQFAVSNAVLDGIDPEISGEMGTWVVDFEGMAKAFLSSHFMAQFDWQDVNLVNSATNILRNFYNYLLYHDVAPEYKDQILAARQVCDDAENEFIDLQKANKLLPGKFNMACSTLCGGKYASIRPVDPNADWVLEEDKGIGLSDEDAKQIFFAGMMAHGSKESVEKLRKVVQQELMPDIVSEEDIGLEVVRVEKCAEQFDTVYNKEQLKNTIVKPTGKLHCIVWDLPHRPPKDLPGHILAEHKAKIGQEYEFIVDEETLDKCYPGLKMEGIVKELNLGIKWIDSIEYVYPSFYLWTLNEPFRDWKPPAPPKTWMLRQMGKENGSREQVDEQTGEQVEGGEHEGGVPMD